ncbi:hypothetical protein I6H07_06295 [Hafnia alvei]|uniref:hypothetical protein n=1 Tax=Hafnia alvei TaxID=569 RepID=UPI000B7370EA|nr:hypothetical protein [Hafnia alvei]MBI0275444.1 hypothetical protein [Hafnia alvei]PNK98561.1 hypothetical protein CEQ28_013690 [Hafnia alvei]
MILPSNESLKYKSTVSHNYPNPILIGMKVNVHEIGLKGKSYFTENMKDCLTSLVDESAFELYREKGCSHKVVFSSVITKFMCAWSASGKATPTQLIEYNRNMRIEAIKIATSLIETVHYNGTTMSVSRVH